MDKRRRAELYLKDSPAKRRILKLVLAEPMSITELARKIGVSPPTVHQHVADLIELGLASKESIGRRAFVSATDLARGIL